jgi:2'-5' RNA ligase
VVIAVTRLGTLPGGRAARVIVADVEPVPALELLQHAVERASESVGIPVEGRAFRPHITLGRVRQGERLPAHARTALAGRTVAASGLTDRLDLYESRGGAGGPRYVARRSYQLVA